MAINKRGSNQLLLLAGTALVLCVAVLSNGNNSVSDSLQGMVLSDKDEIREVKENKVETNNESNERIREEEKKRIELKAEDDKDKAERIREENKKRLEIKISERKSSPEPSQVMDQKRERNEIQNDETDDLENENEYEIESDGVKATTNFPLKLNKKTNELSIVSKDGKLVNVVVLPDQAVENLASNKKIEIIGETTLEENSETGEFEYKAKVVESKKILGLFNIKLNKEYRISSEDGDFQEVELTGINRILNFISF